MEIKITRRYHLTPIRMAIIKSKYLKIQMLARVWRKGSTCTLIGGKVNLYSH